MRVSYISGKRGRLKQGCGLLADPVDDGRGMRAGLVGYNRPVRDEHVGRSCTEWGWGSTKFKSVLVLIAARRKEKDAPFTRNFASTTLPMAAVPSGWYATPILSFTNCANCASVVTATPGESSPAT
jgi:hypothetical protein